jgi:colanic acid/amylovoran biosynthesis glycosyltransferase
MSVSVGPAKRTAIIAAILHLYAPEVAEMLRRCARAGGEGSMLAKAPLAVSRFNRFCLAHARSFHPDLIHAHLGTTGVMALPFIRAIGRPAVVTFYGVDASASIRVASWRENYREMFGRMDLVIVLCNTVRDRLVALGCPPGKLRVWDLPAGIEHYACASRSPHTGPTRFLIAARFVEKKGHAHLLRALAALVGAGTDARLTMIGYGPLKAAIEQQVRDLGLAGRVTIVDTQLSSSFAEVYRAALAAHDIFVLPSATAASGDDEGGPALTLICAQASGLPVISTPFPGAERSMIDGVTGLVCRQDDVESLADRMRWLARHPEAWNALGHAASVHVRARFSLEGQMAALVALYREAAGA